MGKFSGPEGVDGLDSGDEFLAELFELLGVVRRVGGDVAAGLPLAHVVIPLAVVGEVEHVVSKQTASHYTHTHREREGEDGRGGEGNKGGLGAPNQLRLVRQVGISL